MLFVAMSERQRQLVRKERERRGLSVRGVVEGIPISNTAWGDYENGKTELTHKMQQAVALAFGWPVTWPTDGPPKQPPPETADDLRERVKSLEQLVQALGERVVKTDAKIRKPRPRQANPTGEA